MPVNNAQPTLVITQYVALTGIYPVSDNSTGGPGGGLFTLGMVRNFGGSFEPYNDLNANGQTLQISQYSALFSVLGTTFGGNGSQTFRLPDLANRLAVSEGNGLGAGSYVSGQVFGSGSFSLLQSNLPTSAGGNGTLIDNDQSSLATQYIIRIEDYFADAVLQAGEVVQFAGARTPDGYFDCDGRSLSIAQYPELFAVIGTAFGGDGTTTFNLPDLRGRSAVGTGGSDNFTLGQQVGGDVAITQANMPVNMGGSGQPVNNYGPGLVLNYLICTQGQFPSRDDGASPEGAYMFGEIILYAGTDVPPGFARCDGSLISIASNSALYSLLGVQYGGDGRNNFALPDLRGSSAVAYQPGINTIGQENGSATFTLTSADMPSLNLVGTAGNEALYGGDSNDLVNGNDGNDTLTGNGGNDTMNGGQGTDVLMGGAGNDTLNGGLGGDTARYSGNRSQYTVTRIDADSLTITGPDGTDTVNEVESFSFADGTFTFQEMAPPPVPTEGDDVLDGTENADTIDALAGNDTVNGLAGDDLLIGNDGNDTLNGGEGDDTLRGGAGTDALNGGNGIDTADYSASTTFLSVNLSTGARSGDASGDTYSSIENLTGGSANDALTGDANANVLTGGGGNDSLRGGLGVDTLIGGLGGDQYYIDAGDEADIIVEQTGDTSQQDTIYTTLATYTIADNVERLHGTSTAYQTLNGNAADNVFQKDAAGGYTVNAGGGNDTLFGAFTGSWDDILNGGDGNDRIYGYGGNDQLNGDAGDDLLYGGAGADAYNGGAGTDYVLFDFDFGATVGVNVNLETGIGTDGFGNVETYSNIEYVFGAALNDQLTGDANINYLGGAAGDDILSGGGGNDQLIGGIGNDVIDGGLGNDFLIGGAGNDVIVVDSTSDRVIESAGEGTDEVRTILSTFALGVTASSANIENLTGLLATGQTLIGNAGDNVITGGAGDDILRGGGGADTLNGGSGQDTADYSTSNAGVTIDLGANSAIGGDAQGDNFDNIENITGSGFNDMLSGDTTDNILNGGAGDDIITGSAGNDTLLGGSGSDTAVYLGNRSDYVITQTGPNTLTMTNPDGTHTVTDVETFRFDDGDYTFSALLDSTPPTTPVAPDLDAVSDTGSSATDNITTDTTPTVTGTTEAGAAVVVYDTDGTTVLGTTTADATTGAYSVTLSVLSEGVHALTVVATDTTGNRSLPSTALNVTIDTTAPDEPLMTGIDIDDGQPGDRITSDNTPTLNGTAESFATVTILRDGVEVGTVTADADGVWAFNSDTLARGSYVFATQATDVAGNVGPLTTGNTVRILDTTTTPGDDQIQGTTGSDTIATGDGNDEVDGLDGDDTLFGQGGDDILRGGEGDDVVSGGSGNDALDGGEGIDTADYSGAASGVRAQLNTGAASNDGDGGSDILTGFENLTGSDFNDLLVGDGGANIIRGGLGSDVIIAGAGNDTIYGGTGSTNELYGGTGDDLFILEANDTVVEFAGEGVDTVEVKIGVYNLGANLERLVYTGTGSFIGTGNSANNTLIGGAGDDVLRGRGGSDTLDGGLGTDVADYSQATAAVKVRLDLRSALNDGEGGVDNLVSIESLTGSQFNDVMVGDSGDNVIIGGLGVDVLLGGSGDDIIMGGQISANEVHGGLGNDYFILDAPDTVVEQAGEGIDTVESRVSTYTLAANVENLIYTGPASFSGWGNGLDNRITGGVADDYLRGMGGNDTIDGAGGTDTLYLRGLAADYTITAEGAGYRIVDAVSGRDGSTFVTSIEQLQYSNNSIRVLTYPAPNAGETADKDAGAPQVSRVLDEVDTVIAKTHEDGPHVQPGTFDADIAKDSHDTPQVQPGAFDISSAKDGYDVPQVQPGSLDDGFLDLKLDTDSVGPQIQPGTFDDAGLGNSGGSGSGDFIFGDGNGGGEIHNPWGMDDDIQRALDEHAAHSQLHNQSPSHDPWG